MIVSEAVRIIGTYISPYVRKVLVALDLKGVPYEIDPIIPFMGDDRFTDLSPVRRIPVLVDDQVTLADSSVICQYLEDRYPEPALYPGDVADRARARWLEEYADTRMGEVFIWRLFNEVAINPFVWGVKTNPDVLEATLRDEVPSILDYLEGIVAADRAIFDRLSIADIAIASFFRNATFARFQTDHRRWPKTAAFVERTLALPCFEKLKPYEEALLRTPIPGHRAALETMGAPLTAESVGTAIPRRGVLRT